MAPAEAPDGPVVRAGAVFARYGVGVVSQALPSPTSVPGGPPL